MEGKGMTERASLGFARKYRLGNNKNYRYVYRRGKSHPSKNLVLIYLKGKEQRFGFSVSAKVGKMRTRLKCGKYIFIARPALKTVPHEALTRELESLLARAKLVKEDM